MPRKSTKPTITKEQLQALNTGEFGYCDIAKKLKSTPRKIRYYFELYGIQKKEKFKELRFRTESQKEFSRGLHNHCNYILRNKKNKAAEPERLSD